MKILVISDQVHEPFYSPSLKANCADVDLIISCGDLPYSYLEYFIDVLNVPLFYVHGNHGQSIEYSENKERTYPWGAEDLHERIKMHKGILIAGFDGCLRYRDGNYQYSQFEMWSKVLRMIPRLWVNRIFHGRYLDVLVTHTPPWKINDAADRVHQGFKSFRWLLKTFKPKYHFHGHVHLYGNNENRETLFEDTLVINAYRYFSLKFNQEEF